MSMEDILHQPIHLNRYTKLDFSSNKPCFYCIPSKNISDSYNQNLCRFLQPGLISSIAFEEKLGLFNVNHKIIYTLFLYLICNDWKQKLIPEKPLKFIFKTFCYKNKGTRKIKNKNVSKTFYITKKFISSFSQVMLNTINLPNYMYIYV